MADVRIDTRLSQTTVPATQGPRMLYLLIQVSEISQEDRILMPVNLAVLVDVSESMRIPLLSEAQFHELARRGAVREVVADGIPVWQFQNVPQGFGDGLPCALSLVQQALRQVIEGLTARDTLSLVAFASKVKPLVSSRSVEDKAALLKAIDGLTKVKLGDDTYLAQGLATTIAEASRGVSPRCISRVLVLTDGFTRDEAACWRAIEDARQQGIGVSTMGLGSEFNQELMIDLAEQSGGTARLILDPSQVADALIEEQVAAMNIVCRDLQLRLRFSQGIEVRGMYRVRPDLADLGLAGYAERSLGVSLGDLGNRERRSILLELVIPPRPPGMYRLAHLDLSYTSLISSAPPRVSQDVVVEYSAEGAQGDTDTTVMSVVERVSALKLQLRAAQDLQAGDTAGATRRLHAAATRLLNMGEAELADAVRAEADHVEQHSQMSAMGTRRLRYETRRLTQRLDA